jgi:hypothetical protein
MVARKPGYLDTQKQSGQSVAALIQVLLQQVDSTCIPIRDPDTPEGDHYPSNLETITSGLQPPESMPEIGKE